MGRATFQHAELNGEEISIRSAVSGGKGYRCLGCGSPMMACIGNVQIPHFRHQADVGAAKECVWSDETYRHMVAKRILQMKRSIEVPPVKITVPPEYGDEEEVVIRGARTVQAHKVLIERYVYLDELGNVRLTRDEVPSKNLIAIKPDVLFLDHQDKIILMIEICATHKVDAEKLAKLITIGIDTVEVRIPPVPEMEDIEKILKRHHNTQWLYNYERAHTNFDPSAHLPKRKGPGAVFGRGRLPSGEDVRCRAFRLRNIIRQLEAYMGSGDFGRRKSEAADAIRQVKGAGVEAGKRFLRMDDAARAAAEKNIRKRDGLDEEVKQRHRGLEQRYQLTSGQVKGEEEELRREEEEVGREERELSFALAAEAIRASEEYAREEAELGASLEREESRVRERVDTLKARVSKLREERGAGEDEEAELWEQEKRLRAANYYVECQVESERHIDSWMRETLDGVNREANGIGDDVRRITGIKEKYLRLEGKADTGRQD